MRRESYRRIAEECGTPAYVFDTDVLRDKIAFLKDNLGGKVRICYDRKVVQKEQIHRIQQWMFFF